MARTEKMITRTITENKYLVYAANLTDMRVAKVFVSMPEPVDEKRERIALEKALDINGLSVMKYEKVDSIDSLYAMTESDFLKYAHKVEKD